MTKQERHDAIRERARDAIRNLYHNATPDHPYPMDEAEAALYMDWFYQAAADEIDYINDGGAYGTDYRKTLQANCNAGRYRSERARRYYVRKGMRDMERERARCNSLDSRSAQTNALWERITEYGRLYQWGRGGRTLAPDHLINQYGPSFGPKESVADDLNMYDLVELIQIVESFNRHVAGWCSLESLTFMWLEHFGGDLELTAELGSN